MSMQVLLPEGWDAPIGYANGIAVDGGRIVFVAGQVGWNEHQKFESEEIVPQFRQALKNILAVLKQAGGAGAAVYFGLCVLLRVEALEFFLAAVFRRLRRR